MILEEKNTHVRWITRDPEPSVQDPPNRRSITTENLIEDGALTQQRLDKYRTLLRETQTIERVHRGGYEIVWFTAIYVGWVGDSMEKGIVYRRPEPESLFDSFDEFPNELEPNTTGFKKIEDDWYIYFTFDP